MSKGSEMGDCCVSEEDYGECWDMLFEVAELLDVKGLVPADIDEDFDAAVELEKRLGGAAGRLSAA